MENRQLKSLISWILFLVTTMSFAHNEKEFTSGNTDPYNTEVRNMLLAMHKQPQPGIDLPDGGYSKGRIAIDSDGNVFAPDDLGAIPWGIGILWSTNHLNDVVHISYNNNPNPDRHANVAKDDPNLTQTEEYRHIMKKTAEIFKLDESIIYDFTIDDQKTKAINSLVTEINKSTASDPLYIVEAGSYYYLYLAFAASDASKHEFVTVISHSMWNDLECHDSNANENILDVLRDFPNVKIDGIVDQNYGSNPQGGTGLRENRNDSWGQIAWMKTSTVPEINWMHTCAEKQDPS